MVVVVVVVVVVKIPFFGCPTPATCSQVDMGKTVEYTDFGMWIGEWVGHRGAAGTHKAPTKCAMHLGGCSW
jgi:hypothetical protein